MNPKQTEGELRNAKLGLYFFGANSRGGISHMQSEPMEHKLKIESTQAARKENKVFFFSILSSTFFQTFWLPPAVAHRFGVPSDSIQWWW